MADRICFFLDEHIHSGVADALRRRGIEVVTCQEAQLRSRPDSELQDYCVSHGCVIVTHDEGFLALHAAGTPHAGIAYCAQGARTVGQIIRSLIFIYEVLEPPDMVNHLEYL